MEDAREASTIGAPAGSIARRLRDRLARPLPGAAAQRRLAPSDRAPGSTAAGRAEGCRQGAALVLVYPHAGRPHTVLTLRSTELSSHAGQVSFPGGRIDPGESARDAALREAWEEMGIAGDDLDVLGPLTPLYIAPTRYCLHPWLATAARRPDFRPQPTEVAATIEAPLALFVDAVHVHVETWRIRGEPREIPHYVVGEHKVWGATAMVLAELGAVWSDATREAAGT